MKSIRSGSGLGDSLYLQGAVRHLVERGHDIEVCSNWPDVFRPLAGKVAVSPFRRNPIDIRAHYAIRKGEPRTDQFEDVCIAAGIRPPVEFRLDWKPVNRSLVDDIRSGGKPVIAVLLPRRPFDRSDGFGSELLPDCKIIQSAIDQIGARATFVQIGAGDPLYRFTGIDLDLANKTSVCDVLDAGYAADGFLGYVSFFVPLAESLGKPGLFVWSQRGLESRHEFVRQITPAKIFHCATSKSVIDNCTQQALAASVEEFCTATRIAASLHGQDGCDRRLRAGGSR